MRTTVRIATRKSRLAMWQANFIKELLQKKHPEIDVELLGLLTTADKMLATPLNKIGGKGLFVKELEKAILEHEADIAVHSIKDLPGELPDGFELAVVCKREDPRDAFISNKYQSLEDLPSGACIGTSSLRRQAQILAQRSDIVVKPLRGNVGSRLEKLDDGEFDAIILAVAGLKRLQLSERIASYFSIDKMLPAAGQGAIGIECRLKDKVIGNIISFLNDVNTHYAILAERVVVEKLGGSCQFPIAAHAILENNQLLLKALVSDPTGNKLLTTQKMGPIDHAQEIGLEAAEDLIAQGAFMLLQKIVAGSGYDAGQ